MISGTTHFVSETSRGTRPLLDPSVRYRCFHPAEVLTDQGQVCAVASADQFYSRPNLNYDTYVFHRPKFGRPSFVAVIEALKKAGRRLIADYDDLIFGDEEAALGSPAVKNKRVSDEAAIESYRDNLAALRLFDEVTTSTEPLAERVRAVHPHARVTVVPNIVPPSVTALHDRLRTWSRPRAATTIGYFAGTRSHDKDIEIAGAVLHRVLSENPDFTLLVIGPVALPHGLGALPNVTVAPVTDYLRMPARMSLCSTVIAPLETGGFNDCKSRVKLLEAALSGCRLVATPIPDMIAAGTDHFVPARSRDDWYEALSCPPDDAQRAETAARNFAFLDRRESIDVYLSGGARA